MLVLERARFTDIIMIYRKVRYTLSFTFELPLMVVFTKLATKNIYATFQSVNVDGCFDTVVWEMV